MRQRFQLQVLDHFRRQMICQQGTSGIDLLQCLVEQSIVRRLDRFLSRNCCGRVTVWII